MSSTWEAGTLWPKDCRRCGGHGFNLSGGPHGTMQRCSDCGGSGSWSKQQALLLREAS